MRKTINDVRGQFRRVVADAQQLGFDVEGWQLEPGSSTNGISWKLTSRNGTSPAIRLGGWSNEYLGMTAGEAYHTLYTLACAFEAVLDLRRAEGDVR